MLEASKLCNITGSSCLMAWCHMGFLSGMTPFYNTLSTAWVFHLYFQLPYRPEETCFQQAGSSVVEGTSQSVLGSSD
jgi:hypothetical protein